MYFVALEIWDVGVLGFWDFVILLYAAIAWFLDFVILFEILG